MTARSEDRQRPKRQRVGRRAVLRGALASLGTAGLRAAPLAPRLGWPASAAALGAATASEGCSTDRGLGADEIALWFSYGGENRRVLLDLVARFHSVQRRIRVTPTFQGDYFEGLAKLRTALFAGATPTLTHVVGEVVPYLYAAGALAELDAIGSEVVADIVPALGQRGTFVAGDEYPLVALPFNRSTPIAFYNRDLFSELGLSPPETWDDLREVARRTTKRTGRDWGADRWGFECPVDWWFWVALLGQAGGELVDRASGAVTLGGPAGARALELWKEMVHRDRSMKPPPGRDYDAWQATNVDFLSGRAAMIWTSTAFLRYLERNAPFRVGAAPLPGLERRAVPTGGTFFVVPKPRGQPLDAHRTELALVFLRWMMAPEQANEWATRTGYMPVSRSGLAVLERSGYYDERPNDRVTIDQLDHAMPWPWAAELFRVQREAVQPRLERVVLRDEDARAALTDAVRSIAR